MVGAPQPTSQERGTYGYGGRGRGRAVIGRRGKKGKKTARGATKTTPHPRKKIAFDNAGLRVHRIITLNPQVSNKIYYLYENDNNDGRVTYKEWSID